MTEKTAQEMFPLGTLVTLKSGYRKHNKYTDFPTDIGTGPFEVVGYNLDTDIRLYGVKWSWSKNRFDLYQEPAEEKFPIGTRVRRKKEHQTSSWPGWEKGDAICIVTGYNRGDIRIDGAKIGSWNPDKFDIVPPARYCTHCGEELDPYQLNIGYDGLHFHSACYSAWRNRQESFKALEEVRDPGLTHAKSWLEGFDTAKERYQIDWLLKLVDAADKLRVTQKNYMYAKSYGADKTVLESYGKHVATRAREYDELRQKRTHILYADQGVNLKEMG